MHGLLAATILGGFGLGAFSVDPKATTMEYVQNEECSTIKVLEFLNEVWGGYFNSVLDLSADGTLTLQVARESSNLGSSFLVELYSEAELIGIYEGNTENAVISGSQANIELMLVKKGSDELSNVRGFQLIWIGDEQAANFKIHNICKIPRANSLQDLAQTAKQLLASGITWNKLDGNLKYAYANIYPTEAVGVGGASALNLMTQPTLTPALVEGYVKYDNHWQTPQLLNGNINPSTLGSNSPDWPGWGRSFPVVRILDPVMPAELVGSIQVISVLSSGRFRGYFYLATHQQGSEHTHVSGINSNFGYGYQSVTFQGEQIRVLQPR